MPPKPLVKTDLFDNEEEDIVPKEYDVPAAQIKASKTMRLPNLQDIIEGDISTRTDQDRIEEKPWLQDSLLVKCLNRELSDGKYFKRIGHVQKLVEGGWGAEVRMVESQDILLLDQEDCGTALPKVGESIRVVSGQYAGSSGTFIELSPDGKDAVVELRGRRVSLSLNLVCAGRR